MPTGISYVDETFNPVQGCSPVSPGCSNCYARGIAHRFKWGLTDDRGEWTGDVRWLESALEKPLGRRDLRTCLCCDWESGQSWCPVHVAPGARTTRGRRYLTPSMGDYFQQGVPDVFLEYVFATMEKARTSTFLVLTKRIREARAWLEERHCMGPIPNVVIGCTVENQEWSDRRLPLLAKIAALGWRTWISCEPLISDVNLRQIPLNAPHLLGERGNIEFVAVGAETGPGARRCETGWIRSIVEQCSAAGVRCHVKQLGKGVDFNPDDWPRDLVQQG
jgi:protein gp37